MDEDVWWGCYQESLKGVLVDEAFAHPAKGALGLAKRIYGHAMAEGWLVPGRDLVLDPMAGVGTFGVVAAGLGLPWVGIELEERFVAWARQSFGVHARTWTALGKPQPRMIHGDARELSRLVGEAGLVVSSPPYADSVNAQSCGIDFTKMGAATGKRKRGPGTKHYETLMGQLNYRPNAVISSPPYSDGCRQTGGEDRHPEHLQGGTRGHVLRSYPEATLVVSSPPYAAQMNHGGDTLATHGIGRRTREQRPSEMAGHSRIVTDGYGASVGQIGSMSQDTYFDAMHHIYRACFAILPAGGDAVSDQPGIDFCDCGG